MEIDSGSFQPHHHPRPGSAVDPPLLLSLPLGTYVFSHCTDSEPTVCVRCSSGEYQPGLTENTRCLQQKYCDPGQSAERRRVSFAVHEQQKPTRFPRGDSSLVQIVLFFFFFFHPQLKVSRFGPKTPSRRSRAAASRACSALPSTVSTARGSPPAPPETGWSRTLVRQPKKKKLKLAHWRAPPGAVLRQMSVLESAHGRKKCTACKKGFFSVSNNAEPCKQWTR